MEQQIRLLTEASWLSRKWRQSLHPLLFLRLPFLPSVPKKKPVALVVADVFVRSVNSSGILWWLYSTFYSASFGSCPNAISTSEILHQLFRLSASNKHSTWAESTQTTTDTNEARRFELRFFFWREHQLTSTESTARRTLLPSLWTLLLSSLLY